MSGNYFCDCNHAAERVCICEDRRRFFCVNHLTGHKQKIQGEHQDFPIKAEECIQEIGVEEFKRRVQRLQDTREVLENKIREAEDCYTDIETQFERFAATVERKKRTELNKVNAFIACVRELAGDFERNLSEMACSSEYRPRNTLEEMALGRRDLKINLLRTSLKEYSENPNKLEFDTTVECNRGLLAVSSEQPAISIVHGRSLYRVGITDQSSPRRIRIEGIPNDLTKAVCCLIDNQTLFACGGDDPQQAVKVTIKDGSGRKLRDMSQKRSEEAGIVFIDGTVYVFGGLFRTSELRSSEKYDTSSRKWSEIKSMQYPRRAFTPCAHKGCIYLLGGYTRTGEKYNPTSNLMEDLDCGLLPIGPVLSFPLGDRLVVYASGVMYKTYLPNFKLGEYRNFKLPIPALACTPFPHNSCLYFAAISAETVALWVYNNTESVFRQCKADLSLSGRR